VTPRRPRQRGIALLLVLWVFMVLGVLALDFSQYMRDDAMASVNFADETRGYYVALAGMNKAIWDAMRARDESGRGIGTPTQGGRPQRNGADHDDDGMGGPHLGLRDDEIMPADGQWHQGDFAGAQYEVRITDESGKIPINKVDEALLTKVVTNLLVGPNSQVRGIDRRAQGAVAEVVDAILDWRDPDNLPRMHGAENEYYLAGKRGYPAKNAYFDDPQELLLVKGVTPELFYGVDGGPGLRDVISVHNRSGSINVRTMTGPVLQAMLGIEPGAVEDLLAQRDADPQSFVATLQSQLGSVESETGDVDLFVDEPAHTVLVEARADTRETRNRANVAAVVELSADEFDGPKILRWLDRAPWTGPMPTGRVGEDAPA
jgi:general secretion pathway protein K